MIRATAPVGQGAATGRTQGPSHLQGRPVVLLVEDEPDLVHLTVHTLETGGTARVQVAHDGPEALAALSASQPPGRVPALVLLDLKLPGMHGLEVLEALRAEPATRYLPVVVFTSSRDPQEISRAYEAGANSYVRKPTRLDDLRRVLSGTVAYWTELNEQGPS